MTDTDLTGLDLAGARAYLLDFATSAKLSRKALEAVEAEAATWTRRVGLAVEKGMSDLAAQAQAKVAELASKRESLAAEVADTEAKVRRIREQLPLVAARERSVDADRLLAELQLMTGELLGESGMGSEAGATGATGSTSTGGLERRMAALESQAKVEAELAALKGAPPPGGTPPAGSSS